MVRNCFADWNNYENKPLEESREQHEIGSSHSTGGLRHQFNEISNVSAG